MHGILANQPTNQPSNLRLNFLPALNLDLNLNLNLTLTLTLNLDIDLDLNLNLTLTLNLDLNLNLTLGGSARQMQRLSETGTALALRSLTGHILDRSRNFRQEELELELELELEPVQEL